MEPNIFQSHAFSVDAKALTFIPLLAPILANPTFREAFLVTDAEDRTSFEDVPFANITLLYRDRFAFDSDLPADESALEENPANKFSLGGVSRITLPSKYGRCALAVDIIPPYYPSLIFRLINVHLDSLGDTFHHRAAQLEILASLLREPGCSGGLIAGDFNVISPQAHTLLESNGLVDAWVALHGEGGLDGATWGVRVARRDKLTAGRLEEVAIVGLMAQEMEVLRARQIDVPRSGAPSKYIPCSDHFGLRLTFTLSEFKKILKSKLGFPAVLEGTPKLRVHRGLRIYPRYAFGWLVSQTELARRAVEETNQEGRDPIGYGLQLFQEAGFERCQYQWQCIFPDGHMRLLFYVATNDSPERRDMAQDEEYIARAKAVLRQTGDGKWYHIDTF
ncbi:uncharacterized protein SCHCODRAFT_02745426 [Schizophyllum commune H4-8]|nr:uncharacterized protein SCHCODRAFT_02745426 [Schizophyllum commune H4-8]KAI5896446.1 hypothetical protein SCHCODRAFT_02745426 [Schizophyllum commune H4-8]